MPSDEDMEDILEHIDEDVEIPDDEDDTDLEDTDMITDTIPMLKGNFVILAKQQASELSNFKPSLIDEQIL